MSLNFSKLYQIGNEKIVQSVENPVKENIPEPEQVQSSVSLDAVSDTNRRNLEMYSSYQANIKTAGAIESDITKGLQQGKPLAVLFLQAMKVISLMTGNSFTYQNTVELLQAVYGFGLHEPDVEALTAEKVRERLEKLENSLILTTDRIDKAHIQNAIDEHKRQLARLKANNSNR